MEKIFDTNLAWELKSETPERNIYMHKDLNSLFRMIDFKNERILFSDTGRIYLEGIIDINKPLSNERKTALMPLLLSVINSLKPIEMPYIPEKLKVYIEDIGPAVSFLYYMDSDSEKSLIAVKRYYKVINDPVYDFVEISRDMFEKERENVDKA